MEMSWWNVCLHMHMRDICKHFETSRREPSR